MNYCLMDPYEQTSVKIETTLKNFGEDMHLEISLPNLSEIHEIKKAHKICPKANKFKNPHKNKQKKTNDVF